MTATFAWGEDYGAATGNPNRGTTQGATPTHVNWMASGSTPSSTWSSFPIATSANSLERWQYGIFTGTFNAILNGYYGHTATAFGTGLTLKGCPSVSNSTSSYIFTISSGSATAGATYTNNSVTFTVVETISTQTTLVCTASGPPTASGTLTKASGTGDSTITFSAYGQSGLHYTTPSTSTNSALSTDMTSVLGAITSGVTVWFGPTGPEKSGKAATYASACYTNYLVTQLQVGSGAAAGDTANVTMTLQYDEN